MTDGSFDLRPMLNRLEISMLSLLTDAYAKGVADEQERAAAYFKERLCIRLNNYLCTMSPEHDDSITGFNEAWDIVLKLFDEIAAIRSGK